MPNVHDFALKRLHGKSLHNKEEMEYLDLYKQMAMGIPLSFKQYDRADELATKFTQATVDEQDARDRSPYKHVLNAVHSASQSGDPTDAMLIPAQVAGKGIGEIYRGVTGDEDAASLAEASATIGASLINPKQLASFVTKMSKATAATSELKALISEAKAGNAAARSALEEIKAKNPTLVGNAVGEMNEARAAAARPKGNVPSKRELNAEESFAREQELAKQKDADVSFANRNDKKVATRESRGKAPQAQTEQTLNSDLSEKLSTREVKKEVRRAEQSKDLKQKWADAKAEEKMGKPLDEVTDAEIEAQKAHPEDMFAEDPSEVAKPASTNKPFEAQGGSARPSSESAKAPQDNSGKSAPANHERIDPSNKEGAGPETTPKTFSDKVKGWGKAALKTGAVAGAGYYVGKGQGKAEGQEGPKPSERKNPDDAPPPPAVKTDESNPDYDTPAQEADEPEKVHNKTEESSEDEQFNKDRAAYRDNRSQAQRQFLDWMRGEAEKSRYDSSQIDKSREGRDAANKEYDDAVAAKKKFDETPYEGAMTGTSGFGRVASGIGMVLASLGERGAERVGKVNAQARDRYDAENAKRTSDVSNAQAKRDAIANQTFQEGHLAEGKQRGQDSYYGKVSGLGLEGLKFDSELDPEHDRATDDTHAVRRAQADYYSGRNETHALAVKNAEVRNQIMQKELEMKSLRNPVDIQRKQEEIRKLRAMNDFTEKALTTGR